MSSLLNLLARCPASTIGDIDLLRMGFAPASNEDVIIPPAEVEIHDFDVENIEGLTDPDDEHLENVWLGTGFGETQIAVEILACSNENIRSCGEMEHTDQILWAIRVISSYFTFYKTVIPTTYSDGT
ncbi:2092_t:CDS:2 [Paraglomus occultum]|uniref:2092_t:CDS:1 n=1 Tax=Paraglomus occultum TaxID=144539 RepID=A0A9N9C1Y6_9GLOM|nr:2092_t:CDS:2 [Paraglomus occultum]